MDKAIKVKSSDNAVSYLVFGCGILYLVAGLLVACFLAIGIRHLKSGIR
jgi:hypothetical protein